MESWPFRRALSKKNNPSLSSSNHLYTTPKRSLHHWDCELYQIHKVGNYRQTTLWIFFIHRETFFVQLISIKCSQSEIVLHENSFCKLIFFHVPFRSFSISLTRKPMKRARYEMKKSPFWFTGKFPPQWVLCRCDFTRISYFKPLWSLVSSTE